MTADAGAEPDGTSVSEADVDRPEASPSPGATPSIRGLVKVLEGRHPSGQVIAALPGSTALVGAATVDESGRFDLPVPGPDTYRVIVPADGFHSTAESYVTVEPDAGGPTEVTLHRSAGCKVTITVRDHRMSLIKGARLELALTDLPHVTERYLARVTTDDSGQAVLQGSCVRGYLEGRLTVTGRGDFAINHGYVGTGRDQFDIVLPEGPDAGVSYTNDD